jgi:hypothetical protein
MKINFFILLFLFAFSNALPQFVPTLRIDSLKKIAATLYDTARIDCLNQVSLQYVFIEKKKIQLNIMQCLLIRKQRS